MAVATIASMKEMASRIVAERIAREEQRLAELSRKLDRLDRRAARRRPGGYKPPPRVTTEPDHKVHEIKIRSLFRDWSWLKDKELSVEELYMEQSPPLEETQVISYPQQQAADGALCAIEKEDEGMVAAAEASVDSSSEQGCALAPPAQLDPKGEADSELLMKNILMRKNWEEHMAKLFDGELFAPKKKAEAQERILSQQEQKDLAERRSKLAYKYSLFENHPDIVRLTKKTRPDLDSPNGQNVFYLPRDDDEEQFYIPDSSCWLRKCLEEWELPDIDLKDKVRATKNGFEIFTAGFCNKDGVGSGCGAIIRDSSHRPIVARSKVGKSVSPFCLELEGVALGVQLAVEYGAFPFYLYCSSDIVELFLGEFLGESRRNFSVETRNISDPCKECMKQWMRPEEDLDEAAFEIIEKIISGVNELESMGFSSFSVTSGGNGYGGGYKEGSAYFLAQLGKDQEFKVKEIGELKPLWDAIYEEVFGQYVKLEG